MNPNNLIQLNLFKYVYSIDFGTALVLKWYDSREIFHLGLYHTNIDWD